MADERSLGRGDWVRAATAALREGGIDAVRVEALARRLGVTKGSFYWHFRDRADLLDAVLGYWEEETRWLVLEAGRERTPASRLDAYFRLVARHREYPPDSEVLAWARRDADVARRVDATERARMRFIGEQLRAAGLDARTAGRRAKMAYVATQGWIERVSRGAETYASLPAFAHDLLSLMRSVPARRGSRRASA